MKNLLLILLFASSCSVAPRKGDSSDSPKSSLLEISQRKLSITKYKNNNNFSIGAKGNGFFRLVCENNEDVKFQVSSKIELSRIDEEPYSSTGVFSITGPLGSDGAIIKINNNELAIESANYDGIKKVIDSLLSQFKSNPSELLFSFLGRPLVFNENLDIKFDGIIPIEYKKDSLKITWSSLKIQGPGTKSVPKGLDIRTNDCELKFKWLDVVIN